MSSPASSQHPAFRVLPRSEAHLDICIARGMEESHLCSCREWKSTHHDQHHISTFTSRLKFFESMWFASWTCTKIRSPPFFGRESEYAQSTRWRIRPSAPVSNLSIYGSEDTKGARWMPWHRKSTKDAASCDKLRGGANIL